MPLYEYECGKCRKRVEKIQSFSAEPLHVCEYCGGPLERLISAPAIRFKGTGWYVTDYAHGSAAPAKSSEGESKPAAESATNGASSEKPAAPAVATTPAPASKPAN